MTKETYLKSVDILLDAYNERKLFHGKCDACAVGSLLGTTDWAREFSTSTGKQQSLVLNRSWQSLCDRSNMMSLKELHALYASKGYTKEELMKIEFAFESSVWNAYQKGLISTADDGKSQLIGLTAVLNLLPTLVTEEVVDVTKSIERVNKIAKETYCL